MAGANYPTTIGTLGDSLSTVEDILAERIKYHETGLEDCRRAQKILSENSSITELLNLLRKVGV